MSETSPPALIDTCPIGSRWRHKKRGSEYEVVSHAEVQCEAASGDGLTDFKVVIVYRGIGDGRAWVRRPSEFLDGRFERLASRSPDADARIEEGGELFSRESFVELVAKLETGAWGVITERFTACTLAAARFAAANFGVSPEPDADAVERAAANAADAFWDVWTSEAPYERGDLRRLVIDAIRPAIAAALSRPQQGEPAELESSIDPVIYDHVNGYVVFGRFRYTAANLRAYADKIDPPPSPSGELREAVERLVNGWGAFSDGRKALKADITALVQSQLNALRLTMVALLGPFVAGAAEAEKFQKQAASYGREFSVSDEASSGWGIQIKHLYAARDLANRLSSGDAIATFAASHADAAVRAERNQRIKAYDELLTSWAELRLLRDDATAERDDATAERDAALDRAVKAEGRETDMISECEHWQQIVERKDRELATTRASGHREGLEAAAASVNALLEREEKRLLAYGGIGCVADLREAIIAIRASVPSPGTAEEV